MITPYVPLYKDFLDNTKDMTGEQRGKLIRAYLAYAFQTRPEEEITASLGPELLDTFCFMKSQADRYDERIARIQKRYGPRK